MFGAGKPSQPQQQVCLQKSSTQEAAEQRVRGSPAAEKGQDCTQEREEEAQSQAETEDGEEDPGAAEDSVQEKLQAELQPAVKSTKTQQRLSKLAKKSALTKPSLKLKSAHLNKQKLKGSLKQKADRMIASEQIASVPAQPPPACLDSEQYHFLNKEVVVTGKGRLACHLR